MRWLNKPRKIVKLYFNYSKHMTQQYNHSLYMQLLALPDWNDRYKLLIKAARELNPHSDIKQEENLVAGCTAKTWLSFERESG